ncbi:MAG: 50S ribosomal protein L29 [Candidatus Pacebacteria bacterium]|mgnify:CR=1 FL=1|jgi:large subunit ribosomal protein L29|nr:50S ribosomal protein L29 [Candidatus Paceibacterota bacterium]MBT3511525.1 50S ribosomal protein L29 [Candidatus Paceibacterota bacterium]MBT4005005.1 50S ribosomal protein L29 [Candidatus Paceibacterota bacterium]MBT4358781.1 50S ribosomal protein L29 [Candidatus Paceibacterota bacterium]MBT4680589.1 50S ribosomal protein L29 [Candidatus Paceibacterota bacterium]
MKRNDIKALHDKTNGELEQQLVELRKSLAKAKLELPAGKLEDTRLPGKIRDDIARVKTILREKQVSAKESVAKENK